MNPPADDGGISREAALEEAPSEQDHGLAFRLVFGFCEVAAVDGGYAEQWKEIG